MSTLDIPILSNSSAQLVRASLDRYLVISAAYKTIVSLHTIIPLITSIIIPFYWSDNEIL